MEVLTSPCFNCTNRFLGCHDTCKLYLDYVEYNKIKNNKIFEENEINRATARGLIKGYSKSLQKKISSRERGRKI